MNNVKLKNVSASVKARLLNLSRKQNRPFQELLQYYGMERFLFRLSESDYNENFVLKGALLFRVWKINEARPTLDIDLLAKTSNSLSNLVEITSKICEIVPREDDGIQFITASIKGQVMQTQREYEGIRIRFEGRLESARIPMQIDFGFGDVITPAPENIIYPGILHLPPPKLKGYPPETAIAEKLQTMFEKGEDNSRIKDFYDVWVLFRWPAFSFKDLYLAISRTFEKRGMQFNLEKFCNALEEYAQLPKTHILWEQFKKKQIYENKYSFTDVVHDIVAFLKKMKKLP
ncbi:MAG: hypothetical protein K1000chlam2_00438 [Chlamydiae bacterium]|nr:hypothetical protein [Chlamydiota bacterium]